MIEISALEMDIITKLLLSVFLGGIIGLEREINQSAAGLKTYCIVCLGSALFTLAAASIDIGVASGVITGIGFLGAAMVFKTENRVIGLTTAALVWATSAIGFVIGIGLYFAAFVSTALVIFILVPVEFFEKRFVRKHKDGSF